MRQGLLQGILSESLVALLNLHGAIGTRHSLVIGGREVGVIGSSRCRPNDDSACQVLSWTARLLNGVRSLLGYATGTPNMHLSHHSCSAERRNTYIHLNTKESERDNTKREGEGGTYVAL